MPLYRIQLALPPNKPMVPTAHASPAITPLHPMRRQTRQSLGGGGRGLERVGNWVVLENGRHAD